MASLYRGSAISLLQLRVLRPSALQSRAFCGSTRDFSKVYRAPATRTPEEGVATHGRVSASSPERVQEESPEMTRCSPAPWVERWLPAAARPYAMLARLHKPDAIWLYAWPCLWYVTSHSCREFFLGL